MHGWHTYSTAFVRYGMLESVQTLKAAYISFADVASCRATGIPRCCSKSEIKFHGGWLFTDPREDRDVYGDQQGIHNMLAMANDSGETTAILERKPNHHARPRRRVEVDVQGYASRTPSYGSMMRRSEDEVKSQGDVIATISTKGSLNSRGIDESDPSL